MDIHQELAELTRRVAELEVSVNRRLTDFESRLVPQPLPPPPPTADAVGSQPPPPLFDSPSVGEGFPTQAEPRPELNVEALLRWAGVALVTLAGIFLVSTAVTRGWIGPELQLIAAALGGVALLAASVYLVESRRPWSMALGGGGTIVLIASAVASYQWKMMVGAEASLVLVGLALVACVAVALYTRFDSMAAIAGITALIGPLDTLDQFDEIVVLSWAMVILVASTILGLFKHWLGTRLLVGWMSAAVLAVLAFVVDDPDLVNRFGYPALVVGAMTLWLGPVLAERRTDAQERYLWGALDWRPFDLRSVGAVPPFVFLCLVGLAEPETGKSAGIIALAVGALFAGVAAAAWPRVSKPIALTTLLGASGVIAVGLALALDGPALMVALMAQAAVSYYVGRELKDLPMRIGGFVLGLIASGIALAYMIEALDNDGFATVGDGLATLGVVGAWLGAAYWAFRRGELEVPFPPLLGVAWIGSMLWIAAAVISAPQGISLISGAWAMMACVGLVVGLRSRIDPIRFAGLATLGVTLVKLLTLDLAEVEVLVRVALFFAVGVGLIVLGLKVPSLIRSSTPRDLAEGAEV